MNLAWSQEHSAIMTSQMAPLKGLLKRLTSSVARVELNLNRKFAQVQVITRLFLNL